MRDNHTPKVCLCCIYDRLANVIVNRVTSVNGARRRVRKATLVSIAYNTATVRARMSTVTYQLGTVCMAARPDFSVLIVIKVCYLTY